jgi:hypothetical protein
VALASTPTDKLVGGFRLASDRDRCFESIYVNLEFVSSQNFAVRDCGPLFKVGVCRNSEVELLRKASVPGLGAGKLRTLCLGLPLPVSSGCFFSCHQQQVGKDISGHQFKALVSLSLCLSLVGIVCAARPVICVRCTKHL